MHMIMIMRLSSKVVLTYAPFRLDFYRGDDLLISTNARGLLKYEHQRHKKGSAEAVETGEEELANNEVEEVDMWEESYGGHTDSKPNGPTAMAMDFSFAGFDNVYGIPQHADTFSLKDTSNTDPYRLYNLGLCHH